VRKAIHAFKTGGVQLAGPWLGAGVPRGPRPRSATGSWRSPVPAPAGTASSWPVRRWPSCPNIWPAAPPSRVQERRRGAPVLFSGIGGFVINDADFRQLGRPGQRPWPPTSL